MKAKVIYFLSGIGFSILVFAVQSAVLASTEQPMMVKDSLTASKIADAVFVSYYTESEIASQRPLQVKLENNKWKVRGYFKPAEPGYIVGGGTAFVDIDRQSGCMSNFGHDR